MNKQKKIVLVIIVLAMFFYAVYELTWQYSISEPFEEVSTELEYLGSSYPAGATGETRTKEYEIIEKNYFEGDIGGIKKILEKKLGYGLEDENVFKTEKITTKYVKNEHTTVYYGNVYLCTEIVSRNIFGKEYKAISKQFQKPYLKTEYYIDDKLYNEQFKYY